MRVGVALAVALASCSYAHAGDGVAVSGPSVGSRVRITAGETDRPVVGTLVKLTGDRVVLMRGAEGEWSVPVTEIRRWEVSAGRQSQWARGGMIGAAIGVTPGVLLSFGDYSRDVHGDGPAPAVVAAIGAVGGGLVGAAIGKAVKTEKWLPCGLPRPAVALVPLRGGAGVSLNLRWGGRARRTR